MSQIQGDLLVLIVQANYRFSTKSPFFSPPNIILLLYALSVNFPTFLLFYSGLYTLRNRAWEGSRYFPAWHTSVCCHFWELAVAKSSGLHQQRGWRKFLQALVLAWEGLLASQLWETSRSQSLGASGASGLPGSEAAPANTVQLEEGMGMFQVSHLMASQALTENESSWAHPRGHESKIKFAWSLSHHSVYPTP